MKHPIGLWALEEMINAALALDPASAAKLAELEGKDLLIHCPVPAIDIRINPGQAGVRLRDDELSEADVTITSTPLGLLRLLTENDSAGLIQSGVVSVDGDLHLLARFQQILGNLDVDWEGGLAQIFGDIPAHLLGGGLRAALRWGRSTHHSLSANLNEYLHEELQLLPTRMEFREFTADIHALQQETDRLQARIEALQQGIEPGTKCLDCS